MLIAAISPEHNVSTSIFVLFLFSAFICVWEEKSEAVFRG